MLTDCHSLKEPVHPFWTASGRIFSACCVVVLSSIHTIQVPEKVSVLLSAVLVKTEPFKIEENYLTRDVLDSTPKHCCFVLCCAYNQRKKGNRYLPTVFMRYLLHL